MALTQKGYVLIWRNGKHVYEHRYKIEQKLGRPLKTSEQVHHKNGKRFDNRLSNLEFCKNQLDHVNKSKSWGRPKQKPCFCGKQSHGKNLCRKHYARKFRSQQGW